MNGILSIQMGNATCSDNAGGRPNLAQKPSAGPDFSGSPPGNKAGKNYFGQAAQGPDGGQEKVVAYMQKELESSPGTSG